MTQGELFGEAPTRLRARAVAAIGKLRQRLDRDGALDLLQLQEDIAAGHYSHLSEADIDMMLHDARGRNDE